jgi:integrase
METQTVIVCPSCDSKRVFRDGFRKAPLNANSQKPIQRYRCAEYGHRFDELTILNTVQDNKGISHLSAFGAKKMVSMQKTKICMGKERTLTANEIKAAPQIERLATQLFNDGKDKMTARNYRTYLSYLLINGADLFDPEDTKATLAKMPMKKSTKRLIVSLLKTWYEYNGIFWKPPTYNRDNEIPYIPTEQEIDELIAGLGKVCSVFCQILKDTGARSGEIARLHWTDIDFKTHTINIKAEKRSNGRVLPLSDKTIEMLANLKRRKDGKMFSSITSLRSNYVITRRRISEKLANPNIAKIHFHTFRHWKATTELHNFHDRERVQIILGHKCADSTETYVHIDKMLYLNSNNDQFVCKVADTLEEVLKLVEAGYEFHVEIQGHKVFRKRK